MTWATFPPIFVGEERTNAVSEATMTKVLTVLFGVLGIVAGVTIPVLPAAHTSASAIGGGAGYYHAQVLQPGSRGSVVEI